MSVSHDTLIWMFGFRSRVPEKRQGGANGGGPAMTLSPEWAVLVLACFTAAWGATLAYGVDRNGGPDELESYNPIYMVSHYGRATYPVFFQFDATIVHPPLHSGVAGGQNKRSTRQPPSPRTRWSSRAQRR